MPQAPAPEMSPRPPIDLAPLHRAVEALREAIECWHAEPVGSRLKRHLRGGAIQAFEFSYELSVRMVRRVLMERASSAQAIVDLSFRDLWRLAADAGLTDDPMRWWQWRELRNATGHTDDEARAESVAGQLTAFADDATALLARLTRAVDASSA